MAAGLGFKTFVTGDVLTAGDTNGYLMQGVWVFATAAARDAAVTSPQEGNTCYLKDTDVLQCYSGSAWVTKSAGSSTQNFTLLSTTTLTGAGTITISSLSGYNQLLINVEDASTTAASPLYTFRLNSDSTSKYSYTTVNFNTTPGVTGFEVNNLNGKTSYFLGTGSSTTTGYTMMNIQIDGANAAGVKPISHYTTAAPATAYPSIGKGLYTGTSVISSVSFICDSGTFDAGTVRIYGAA